MFRQRLLPTARSLIAVARTEQLGFLAAAIAYYAFVSVVPLLLVTVALTSTVAGPTFTAQVLAVAGGILSPEAIALLGEDVSGAGRAGVTLVGSAVLVWSSLRVFRGLDIAFERIYRVSDGSSMVEHVWNALVALGAIGAAIGSVVVIGALLPALGVSLGGPLEALWLVTVLSVVFLPMYYVFPDCDLAVREAVPGAVFAGIGWTVLGTVFEIYAANAGSFQLYGVLGGVLLVLTWFYAGGLLLLSGAVLNSVVTGRRDRQVQQGSLRDHTQARMSDTDGTDDEAGADDTPDDEQNVETVSERVDYDDIAELRRELDDLEDRVEDRTVHRDELEADIKQYVRSRVRRGHARGWGPYLVLLYGTVMTLGAFYFLDGAWAFLAMLVIWLSTLGLYTLMVLVGVTVTAAGLPGRIRDRLRDFRD